MNSHFFLTICEVFFTEKSKIQKKNIKKQMIYKQNDNICTAQKS